MKLIVFFIFLIGFELYAKSTKTNGVNVYCKSRYIYSSDGSYSNTFPKPGGDSGYELEDFRSFKIKANNKKIGKSKSRFFGVHRLNLKNGHIVDVKLLVSAEESPKLIQLRQHMINWRYNEKAPFKPVFTVKSQEPYTNTHKSKGLTNRIMMPFDFYEVICEIQNRKNK